MSQNKDLRKAGQTRFSRLFVLLALLAVMLLAVPVSAAPRLSKTRVSLAVGQSFTLKAKGVGKKKVTWSTASKSIALVSSKGVVKAKRAGTTRITAKVGTWRGTCTVQVFPASMQKNDMVVKGEAVQDQYNVSSLSFVDRNGAYDTASFYIFAGGDDADYLRNYLSTYRGIFCGNHMTLVKAAYGKKSARTLSVTSDRLYTVMSNNGDTYNMAGLRKLKSYIDYNYSSYTLRFYFDKNKRVGGIALFKNYARLK